LREVCDVTIEVKIFFVSDVFISRLKALYL